jgi:DNA-binding beta-propeller fold protein YncE
MRFLPAVPFSAVLASALVGSIAQGQVVHDPLYQLSTELTGLANPQGIDLDAAGNVYLADSANGTILKGVGGVYSPIVSGIEVSEFFGLELGAIAVHVGPDQTLWYGEGGRQTGVEQVHHLTLDGAPIQSLAPTTNGGNWSGIAIDPVSGRLYASSANRDRVFVSDPTGGVYGAMSEFANTGTNALTSPTGMLLDGGRLLVGYYGPWGAAGGIASYDVATGALIDASFVVDVPGLTALDRLGDGRILATQYGNFEGDGVLWAIDPATGEKTQLVSGLIAATGVAVGPDGTTIYLVDMGIANEGEGILYKLTVVPSPATLALAIVLVHRRRR